MATVQKLKTGLISRLPKVNYSVVLVILLIGASFLIGRLSAQVEYLKGGGTVAAGQQAAAPAQQQQKAAPEVTTAQIKDLLGDKNNITFGNKNSKLIFVEFSDPSCPFCHVAAGLNGALNKPRQRAGESKVVPREISSLPR